MTGTTPASYRKKPVEVIALRWLGDNYEIVAEFVGSESCLRREDDGAIALWIAKSRNWGIVNVNDWIIAERDGVGYYPCTAEQFTDTYEPVE